MSQKIYVGKHGTTRPPRPPSPLSSASTAKSPPLPIIKDRYTPAVKGFGFIEMADAQAAEAAIATLNNQEFEGRRLRVNVAENKPRGSRPALTTIAADTVTIVTNPRVRP